MKKILLIGIRPFVTDDASFLNIRTVLADVNGTRFVWSGEYTYVNEQRYATFSAEVDVTEERAGMSKEQLQAVRDANTNRERNLMSALSGKGERFKFDPVILEVAKS